jgi:hypothetical protein
MLRNAAKRMLQIFAEDYHKRPDADNMKAKFLLNSGCRPMRPQEPQAACRHDSQLLYPIFHTR